MDGKKPNDLPEGEVVEEQNPFDHALGGLEMDSHPRNVMARLKDDSVPGYRDPTSGMIIRLVRMTIDQHDVVMQTVKAVRRVTGYDTMSQGRALELVCADFLAGDMDVQTDGSDEAT